MEPSQPVPPQSPGPSPQPFPPTNNLNTEPGATAPSPQPPPPPQSVYPQYPPPPAAGTAAVNPQPAVVQDDDQKDFVIAFLLSWLLGGLGADRFYLGYTGKGIAKLLTFGGLGIWAVIDTVRLAFGKLKDKEGLPLKGYEKNKKWVRILAVLHIVLVGLFVIFILFAVVLGTKAGVQQRAYDTERKTDISRLQAELDTYYLNNKGAYPTLSDMNSPSFRQSKMSDLPIDALQDPKGTSPTLVSSPTVNSYSYQVSPTGCDNTPNNLCTSYILTAELVTGGIYTKQSP